jgi:AcrR family transcriptional regulator
VPKRVMTRCSNSGDYLKHHNCRHLGIDAPFESEEITKIVRTFDFLLEDMSRSIRKGEQTRAAILGSAIELASRSGLEGLTIGSLAERLDMSKSGVFAHFGSREELQIAVLRAYEQQFVRQVLLPSVKKPRGLPRLVSMLEIWFSLTENQAAEGCLWISGASEYDGRPGAVRDELVRMVRAWQGELNKAIALAIAVGHLGADTDIDQLQFELYGVVLAMHHDGKLLESPDAGLRARRAVNAMLRARSTLPEIDLLAALSRAHAPSTHYLN